MLNDNGRFSLVISMLDQLSWPNLQTSCKVSRFHALHKVFYQQLSLTIPLYHLTATRSMRQYHPLHYILPYSSTMAHQNSYFSRTTSDWNMLLMHLIEVTNTDIFKAELQLFVL